MRRRDVQRKEGRRPSARSKHLADDGKARAPGEETRALHSQRGRAVDREVYRQGALEENGQQAPEVGVAVGVAVQELVKVRVKCCAEFGVCQHLQRRE